MQQRRCDEEFQQRGFAEALTVKDAAFHRPVTVMPCGLPSKAVVVCGQCVSLLQAAKLVQAKPEAVDMRKLRQGAKTGTRTPDET